MGETGREAFTATRAQKTAQADEEFEPSEPPDGQVVFINDDYTRADFVVAVLISIFHKETSEAEALMRETHEKGRAVVGVYSLDVAVTRARAAIGQARKAGFPLKVEVLLLSGGENGY